jgi:hypothetical protein
MSTSTDAEISFGVRFEEDTEFPWDDEKYEGEVDHWWLEVTGYKPEHEIYDDKGNYIQPKASEAEVNAYFAYRRHWLDAHPLPFELVNYCSLDYAAYILAVPGSIIRASRGYPTPVSLNLSSPPNLPIQDLLTFCKKYGLKFEGDPCWWLSSYWG